jgi:hypothetical protein
MLIPIKYGTKKVLLGVHDPYPYQCPNCKELNTTDFAVFGEYFHFWYIPILPVEKDGMSTCSNCTFTISSLKYNKTTGEEFRKISKRYRYPLYTYFGVALIFFPIIISVLIYFFGNKN